MPNLILNPSREQLLCMVGECRQSVRIIVPFIRRATLAEITRTCKVPFAQRQLITRADDKDALEGALEYEALADWVKSKARLRVADRFLHAKLFLFDGTSALITSANLTEKALDSNFEVGVLVDDPSIVAAAEVQFERLWSALGPNDTSGAQVREMLAEFAKVSRNAPPRVIPGGLKDWGAKVKVTDAKPKRRSRTRRQSKPRRWWLKMYGTGPDAVEAGTLPEPHPEFVGGLTFGGHSGSPSSLREGDAVFVCWQERGGPKRIGAMGYVARQWDRSKDVAPENLRAINEKIRRWPNVVWLRDVRVLMCPIEDCVNLERLFDELGAATFERTKASNRNGGPAAARAFLRSSRSHPQLTSKAGERLLEMFNREVEQVTFSEIRIGNVTWYEAHAPKAFQRRD